MYFMDSRKYSSGLSGFNGVPYGGSECRNYEAIYFLSDEELLDAAVRYRRCGKTDSIRERHGPLILATMSRSVVAVTAGGRVD